MFETNAVFSQPEESVLGFIIPDAIPPSWPDHRQRSAAATTSAAARTGGSPDESERLSTRSHSADPAVHVQQHRIREQYLRDRDRGEIGLHCDSRTRNPVDRALRSEGISPRQGLAAIHLVLAQCRRAKVRVDFRKFVAFSLQSPVDRDSGKYFSCFRRVEHRDRATGPEDGDRGFGEFRA